MTVMNMIRMIQMHDNDVQDQLGEGDKQNENNELDRIAEQM